MKKIKSKNVRNYVMDDMAWKVDLPRFLKEIAECSKSVPYAASFRILAQVLKVLTELSQECTRLLLYGFLLSFTIR